MTFQKIGNAFMEEKKFSFCESVLLLMNKFRKITLNFKDRLIKSDEFRNKNINPDFDP